MTEPAAPNANRREHERKLFRSKGHLILFGEAVREVRTFDLSIAGVGVIASSNLQPETPCLVRLVIPVKTGGSNLFEIPARVIHAVFSSGEDGFKVGLRFVSLTPEMAQAILRYLNS